MGAAPLSGLDGGYVPISPRVILQRAWRPLDFPRHPRAICWVEFPFLVLSCPVHPDLMALLAAGFGRNSCSAQGAGYSGFSWRARLIRLISLHLVMVLMILGPGDRVVCGSWPRRAAISLFIDIQVSLGCIARQRFLLSPFTWFTPGTA